MSRGSLSVAAGVRSDFGGLGHERRRRTVSIDRPMTLHRLVFAGDVGMGVGHYVGQNPAPGVTGGGMNFEAALGITDRLRARFSYRRAVRQRRTPHARRRVGRTTWTETYGTGGDTAAQSPSSEFAGSVHRQRRRSRPRRPRVPPRRNEHQVRNDVRRARSRSTCRTSSGSTRAFTFRSSSTIRRSAAFRSRRTSRFQASPKLWLGPLFRLSFIDPGRAITARTCFSGSAWVIRWRAPSTSRRCSSCPTSTTTADAATARALRKFRLRPIVRRARFSAAPIPITLYGVRLPGDNAMFNANKSRMPARGASLPGRAEKCPSPRPTPCSARA